MARLSEHLPGPELRLSRNPSGGTKADPIGSETKRRAGIGLRTAEETLEQGAPPTGVAEVITVLFDHWRRVAAQREAPEGANA